jgi:hypothetical protein
MQTVEPSAWQANGFANKTDWDREDQARPGNGPRSYAGPGLAKMLNAIGYLHAQLGEYEQALDCQAILLAASATASSGSRPLL